MPIPLFDCEADTGPLTAAQLNALVTELNKMELVLDVPAPLFQREEMGSSDHPGGPMTFRYLMMHKEGNRYLKFRWQWSPHGPDADSRIFVSSSGHNQNLSTLVGTWDGTYDLQPLNIPAGNVYRVWVDADRDDDGQFYLHYLYESPTP